MSLALRNVSLRIDADTHIHETSLELAPRGFNILLGTTLAGKTTLMRLMAGLLKPTRGAIFFNAKDVTQVPVRERRVAMVYQQFINYGHLPVFENIASPLRVAGVSAADIKTRVGRIADILRLGALLDANQRGYRAGSNNAQRLRARWSRMPTWCCSTNRSPIWTTSCAKTCATNCRVFSLIANARSSTPPQNPRRRCCSAAIPPRCSKAA